MKIPGKGVFFAGVILLWRKTFMISIINDRKNKGYNYIQEELN